MSYATMAIMAQDQNLTNRIKACVAQQNGPPSIVVPGSSIMWILAASPQWHAAWASAVVSNIANPGLDAGVITDHMILSAVQENISKFA